MDEQPSLALSVLLTKVGVNMGDHAQDVITAIDATPDQTIEELAAATLRDKDWRGNVAIHEDWFLTIRIAVSPADPTSEDVTL